MGHQMVFKAWLINKLKTGAGGKLIHHHEVFMEIL